MYDSDPARSYNCCNNYIYRTLGGVADKKEVLGKMSQGFPAVIETETRQERNSIENAADATGNALQQHLESQMDDPLCFSWFANRSKHNRQEIRAALSLSINMLPFWLCTFPVTLNGILIYWCVRLQSNCPTVYRVNSYLTDWFIIHTLYNPHDVRKKCYLTSLLISV